MENGTAKQSGRLQRSDFERGYMDAMLFSLSIGHVKTLRPQIEERGEFLAQSPSKDIREQFADLLRRAEEMFRIEEAHGSGSMLDLESPTVQVFAQTRYADGRPCHRRPRNPSSQKVSIS